jgi:hypothetical protein
VTPTGSVVLTNKTLTTPTIGDLTNAGHNHTNVAGGAQLTDAALSSAVGVTKGGTGLTTATTAYALVCSGTTATGAFQVLNSQGTAGQVLISGGAAAVPSWSSSPTFTNFTNANHNHTTAALGGQITDAALSAAVGPTKGGTGLTATAAWSVVCGGTVANGALQQVASVGTAGQVLVSNAAGLPTWTSAPTIDATNFSAVVSVTKGGTGLATGTTAFGIVCAGTTATGAFQVLNSLGTYVRSDGTSYLGCSHCDTYHHQFC